MFLRFRYSAWLGVAWLAAACSEFPSSAAPPAVPGRAPSSGRATIHEPAPVPAFTVDVQVQGSLTPGQAVTVIVTARSHITAAQAEVVTTVPELELVALRDVRGRIPMNTAIKPAERFVGAVTPGMILRHTVRLVPLAPGYYSIQVAARSGPGASHNLGGRPLADMVRVERWLWIADQGSRITDRFDAAVFSSSHVSTIGAERLKPPRVVGPQAPSFMDPGECDTWQVGFYDGSVFRSIVSATVYWDVVDDQTGYPVSTHETSTGQTGEFSVCADPGTSIAGTVHLWDPNFDITGGAVAPFNSGATNGSVYQLPLWGPAAQTFVRLSNHVLSTNTMFSGGGPYIGHYTHVEMTRCPGVDYVISCYRPSANRIHLAPEHVWGDYGSFTGAHEYGHQFHDRALGGLTGYPNCDPDEPHYIDRNSGMGCAYDEGIADFIAFVVRGGEIASGYWSDHRAESNDFIDPSSNDGAAIEGRVAAFLYDLVDDASYPNGPNNETGSDDDPTAYSSYYVGQVIKTCTNNTPPFYDPLGIDHLIHCFERIIDPVITGNPAYFPERAYHPTWFSENASEPPTWNRAAIRQTWLKDLYLQDPPPPGGGGEDPPDDPPDDPPVCDPPPPGGCMDQLRTSPQSVPAAPRARVKR